MNDLVMFLCAVLAVLVGIEVRLKLSAMVSRARRKAWARARVNQARQDRGLSGAGSNAQDIANLVCVALDEFVFSQRGLKSVREADLAVQVAMAHMAALLAVPVAKAAGVRNVPDVLNKIAQYQYGEGWNSPGAEQYVPSSLLGRLGAKVAKDLSRATVAELESNLSLSLQAVSGGAYERFGLEPVTSTILLKTLFLSLYLALPRAKLTQRDRFDVGHLTTLLSLSSGHPLALCGTLWGQPRACGSAWPIGRP